MNPFIKYYQSTGIIGAFRASKVPDQPPLINQLHVVLTEGRVYNFRVSWEHGRKDSNAPWQHFYKWYLNRTGSHSYIMKMGTTEIMLRRVDIIGFEVAIIEELGIGDE